MTEIPPRNSGKVMRSPRTGSADPIRPISNTMDSDNEDEKKYKMGEVVEARRDGGIKWLPATVVGINMGGSSYDLRYSSDGVEERRVLAKLTRSVSGSFNSGPSTSGARKLNEMNDGEVYRMGDKVQGNYRGKGKWYSGKIIRDRPDGTYDIDYDDGESETRVDTTYIRRIMSDKAVKPTRIEEGSKVEGNYRGKGKWFAGKITRDRGDHTFDIAYDDGESETRVDELLIRLIGGSSSSAVELVEGASVEAFYKGKKWYPGKISRVRLNGTFDISYDDGEKEIGVTRENVRGVASERRGLSPRADRERESASNRIEEGSKVEGNYRGKGKWFAGKITRDRGDHTFDIAYDDGESETRVDELLIRLIGGGGRSPSRSSNRIEEGSKVEGNYRGKGKWFAGKITRDRGDHTFDIAYDDGESETRVDELLIRLIGGSSSSAVELVEGASVEAFYKGKKWYPGKISRVRLNGTFDISYDDGEKEIGVTRENVRGVASERRGLSPRADRERESASNRIEEGSKVEGNYRGKGKWFAGKITRDRGDHTFDIAYDDGESETRVDELLIRLIGGSSSGRSGFDRDSDRGRDADGSGARRRMSRSPDAARGSSRDRDRERDRDRDRDGDRRTRSRSPEENRDREILLSPSLRTSLQSIVQKYQQISTEGTAQSLFQMADETPPTGFVTKKEFKKVSVINFYSLRCLLFFFNSVGGEDYLFPIKFLDLSMSS